VFASGRKQRSWCHSNHPALNERNWASAFQPCRSACMSFKPSSASLPHRFRTSYLHSHRLQQFCLFLARMASNVNYHYELPQFTAFLRTKALSGRQRLTSAAPRQPERLESEASAFPLIGPCSSRKARSQHQDHQPPPVSIYQSRNKLNPVCFQGPSQPNRARPQGHVKQTLVKKSVAGVPKAPSGLMPLVLRTHGTRRVVLEVLIPRSKTCSDV
jgi:hypothetical protein